MNGKTLKTSIKEEVFFKDPKVEYDYFKNRMKVIDKYNNDYIKQYAYHELGERYIRAIASFEDEYEASALIDVYNDCLLHLGYDDYCIDKEVQNYKITHGTNNKFIFVSKTRVENAKKLSKKQ